MDKAIQKGIDKLIELEYIKVNELIRKDTFYMYILAEIEKMDWRTMKQYLDNKL